MLGFGSVRWHPCFPQAGAPGDASRTTCSRPIAAAAVAETCRLRSRPRCPLSSCGARTAFGSRWTTRCKLDIHRHRAFKRRAASAWHVCKTGDRFAKRKTPSAADQPWGLPGCINKSSTAAGAARGLALREFLDGSQYLVDHFTIRSSDGASQPNLRPRRTARQTLTASHERFNGPLAPRNRSSMAANLPQVQPAELRVRRTSTMPSGSLAEDDGYLSPRSSFVIVRHTAMFGDYITLRPAA